MLVGLIVAIVLGGLVAVRAGPSAGTLARDRMSLRVPVLGDVVRYAVVERFCRILGRWSSAGVPMPEAHDGGDRQHATTASTARARRRPARRCSRGEGLASPIADTELFPRHGRRR